MSMLMRRNIQYSFRRARPLNTAYFFNASRYQLDASRYQLMVDSFAVSPTDSSISSTMTANNESVKGAAPFASIQWKSEKAHSRKFVVARPATNTPVNSVQSFATPCSYCLLLGHSHICREDLLRGATGCYRPVAGELVLCSPARAAQTNALHRTISTRDCLKTPDKLRTKALRAVKTGPRGPFL